MCKLKVVNGKGKYKDNYARFSLIRYILNEDHAINRRWGGSHINLKHPIWDMEAHADRWNKNSGVRLRHFVLSFSNSEVTNPDVAMEIGQKVANFFGKDYQSIFAVHENTDNLHLHIIINAISHDGKRYRGTHREFYTLINFLRKSLKKHGIYYVDYKYVDDAD